jgi:hypothetical protein
VVYKAAPRSPWDWYLMAPPTKDATSVEDTDREEGQVLIAVLERSRTARPCFPHRPLMINRASSPDQRSEDRQKYWNIEQCPGCPQLKGR